MVGAKHARLAGRHATGMALWAAFAIIVGACRVRAPCDGLSCAPACPRDASRDTSGRCVCATGEATVLGACVPAAVADAYCGPAARFGRDGCVFRGCGDESVIDAATGLCVPRSTVAAAKQGECAEGLTSIVAHGRAACVSSDAACPRGTLRSGPICTRPAPCPPGSLFSRDACKPVVTVGARDDLPRVDIGAWATLVLGVDGGPGTSYLCRPLAFRSDAFGPIDGRSATLALRLAVVAPDQDLTRVHFDVQAEFAGGAGQGGSRPLPADAESLIRASVGSLIEPLRGLGGEASTGVVEVRVSCIVSDV